MPFTTELILLETTKEGKWKLGQDLVYQGRDETFIVPKDFETDLASVPRLFQNIIPPSGFHNKAAVVHDYLYRTDIVSRRDADGIFRRIMKENGVGVVRRWVMWSAVRLFGWMA